MNLTITKSTASPTTITPSTAPGGHQGLAHLLAEANRPSGGKAPARGSPASPEGKAALCRQVRAKAVKSLEAARGTVLDNLMDLSTVRDRPGAPRVGEQKHQLLALMKLLRETEATTRNQLHAAGCEMDDAIRAQYNVNTVLYSEMSEAFRHLKTGVTWRIEIQYDDFHLTVELGP